MDEWIKVRANLRRHPKVVRIASALQSDKLRVLGGLMSVWSVFDEHTEDGILPGYTYTAMDEEIGWQGFSRAMADVNWLAEEPGVGLKMPEFSTHNGLSAKRRANDAARKRQERNESEPRPKNVRSPSGENSDGDRTKKREKRISSSPDGEEESAPRRRAPKAQRCPMPAEFTQRYAETDPEIVGWAEQKGHDVRTLGLHYEYFLLAVAKTNLQYVGLKGWKAAFKTAVAKNWAGLGVRGRGESIADRDARRSDWLDELTGRGGERGRVIEGSSTTEPSD